MYWEKRAEINFSLRLLIVFALPIQFVKAIIGETGRKLGARFVEHLKDVASK